MDLQLGLFPDEVRAHTPASNGAAKGTTVGPAIVGEQALKLAARLPDSLRMGTSSWSFPGWNGLVYDHRASEASLARDGLAAYGAHPLLRTVGLDRTYYRPIPAEEFKKYAEAVPDSFRFLVKADRLTTSPFDPNGYGIRARNPLFLNPNYAADRVVGPLVEGLGAKTGPLLFQFPPIPPNLIGGRGRFVERLHRFTDALPKGVLYAIELRTPAFLTESYAQMLEATGAVHCFNVHPSMAPLSRHFEVVSPFYQRALVVRWMLHGALKYAAAKERYEPFDKIVDDDSESRERIAVTVLDALIAERPVFVIANNKAEGSAPRSIFQLADRIGNWCTSTTTGEPGAS